MGTKYKLLMLGMLLSTPRLYAQLDSFDISKYKLPDIKRRQLDLNMFTSIDNHIQLNKPEENKFFAARGDVSAQYYSYTNLPGFQGSGSVYVTISPYASREQNTVPGNNYKYGSSAFSGSINLNKTNRFYLSGLFFLEADIFTRASQDNSKYNHTYYSDADSFISRTDNDQVDARIETSVPLHIGFGRIEPVQDARLAVYILDDLQKAGRLSRKPTEAEYLEFSSVISAIKNKRFFDSRIRKIEELKTIDAYLKSHGLVTEPDILYFSVVNDNWDYSSGPNRYSGGNFYMGVEPGISMHSNLWHSLERDGSNAVINSNVQHAILNNFTLSGTTGYYWNKPLNLYWQLEAGAGLTYIYGWYKDKYSGSGSLLSHMPELYASEHVKLGYYPNSRTYAYAGFDLFEQFQRPENYVDGLDKWMSGVGQNRYTGDLDIGVYYYFSPQLRFSGSWTVSSGIYSYRNPADESKDFTQFFSAGFIYSLF